MPTLSRFPKTCLAVWLLIATATAHIAARTAPRPIDVANEIVIAFCLAVVLPLFIMSMAAIGLLLPTMQIDRKGISGTGRPLRWAAIRTLRIRRARRFYVAIAKVTDRKTNRTVFFGLPFDKEFVYRQAIENFRPSELK